MTTFVDTSVLIDVLDETAKHHSWCAEQFEKAKASGPVFVSDVVFSELSVTMPTVGEAQEVIEQLALIRCGYSDAVLFRAGKAYAQYRANKGQKLNVLPDFFIGALAETKDAPLLTRDPKKVGTYFPQIKLVTPDVKEATGSA
jgi:predicted nucleic acid-binding protein